MSAVGLSAARELLRFEPLYNDELRPLLQSLPSHTFEVCRLLDNPLLREVVRGPQRNFPLLQTVLRDPRGSSSLALEGIRALQHLSRRLDATRHKSLLHVPYELNVGDVVQHVQFGHVGVVAARLPVCLESDDWMRLHLGSAQDARLQHPWYLVLVARHDGLPLDFVRYGSQLTHVRLPQGQSIGIHRMLPMYFTGYDAARGRYVPRFDQAPWAATAAGANIVGSSDGDAAPSLLHAAQCGGLHGDLHGHRSSAQPVAPPAHASP